MLFGWYYIKPVVPSLMELTGNRNESVAVVLLVIFGQLVVGWLGTHVSYGSSGPKLFADTRDIEAANE